MRREGWTPCIFYGPELERSVQGKVKTRELERVLSGRWESLRLALTLPGGSEEMCIIREVQRDPLTDLPLHIDFYRLLKGRRITVNIPIEVVGREGAPGLKNGGVLESLHELEVETLPMNIPDVIQVDVSALALGDSIHARDLALPEGVELLADPDEIVAIVVPPKGVGDSPADEGDQPAAADVQVVAKGKAAKEEEGAE